MFRLASIFLVCAIIAVVFGSGDVSPHATLIGKAISLFFLLAFLGSLLLAGPGSHKH